jgi:general secretion pathway protein D
MAAKRQFKGRSKILILLFTCAATVVISGGFLFAADQIPPVAARYRVFSLKHISAEQGKKYLADAGLGTVSQLPGVNALLVTAQAEELVKASALIELVDAEQIFNIKAIPSAPEAAHFPSNEQIASQVGDISIGTFSNPPISTAKNKAIVDVHNNTVIVAAPFEQFDKIISAIEQLRSEGAQAPQLAPSESTEPNKPPEVKDVNKAEKETMPATGPTEAELEKAEEELKRAAASFETAGQAAAGTDSNEPNELINKLLKSLSEPEPPIEPNEPVLHKETKVETDTAASEEQIQKLSQPNTVAPAPAAQTATKVLDINEPNLPAEKSEAEPNLPAEKPAAEPNLKSAVKINSYEPAPIANGNAMLELDLPEKLNIIDLIDLVGKYLQLDYMYDDTLVRGEVALKLQGPIKVKDLYPLLESVLKFRGFVMTRKGNLVTIVPAADALNIDPTLQPEGQIQLGDIVITRVFNLKYIDATSAQNLLTNMKLGANITPILETGTLIVTEYAYRMARVEELLEMVDQPGTPKEFRFRQLKYTMAATLAPKIKTLAEQIGTVSVTIAAPTPEQPPVRRIRGRPAPTPAPAAQTTAAKEGVYLDSDERTNRILMIGLGDDLAVVNDLIDALDVEQQDLRTLRLYDIQHVGAEEVVKKLQELGIIGGTAPTTGRITAGAPARTVPGRDAGGQTPQPAAAAASETEPLVEQPQVVVIESTNSLLVNATPEQHTKIATIISYVDSVTLEQAIPYVIYGLENQDPVKLGEVLQKLIQETVIEDKEGKITQTTIKKTEENIIIVPDENTFSIIVYATKKNQEWIGNLIKQLDKRRPQVLIDVSLVEITKNEEFTYDLSLLTNLTGDLAANNIAIIGGAPFTSATSSASVIEAGFNLLDKDGKPTKRVRGFYSDGPIQMLLDAIDSKGYGRILARPKILVNDNEEGKINTTQRTYVAESQLYYPSGTATGTGTTLEPVVTTTYTPYEAKIELVITPHISEGELLRLDVMMTREDFEKQEAGPPDYATSNIDTTVTVPDGSTIILGGLTKLKQAKSGNKVPLLGDIPIAGALFRSASNTQDDRHLYIFVKANILRPDQTAKGLAQLQQISERNRAGFEVAERRFQEHETFPGVEPEPMDPLRVLEAE